MKRLVALLFTMMLACEDGLSGLVRRLLDRQKRRS